MGAVPAPTLKTCAVSSQPKSRPPEELLKRPGSQAQTFGSRRLETSISRQLCLGYLALSTFTGSALSSPAWPEPPASHYQALPTPPHRVVPDVAPTHTALCGPAGGCGVVSSAQPKRKLGEKQQLSSELTLGCRPVRSQAQGRVSTLSDRDKGSSTWGHTPHVQQPHRSSSHPAALKCSTTLPLTAPSPIYLSTTVPPRADFKPHLFGDRSLCPSTGTDFFWRQWR